MHAAFQADNALKVLAENAAKPGYPNRLSDNVDKTHRFVLDAQNGQAQPDPSDRRPMRCRYLRSIRYDPNQITLISFRSSFSEPTPEPKASAIPTPEVSSLASKETLATPEAHVEPQ